MSNFLVKRKAKGFTAIELLVTFLIIGWLTYFIYGLNYGGNHTSKVNEAEEATAAFNYVYGVTVLSSDKDSFVPLEVNEVKSLALRKDTVILDCKVTLKDINSYIVNCRDGNENVVLNPVQDKI